MNNYPITKYTDHPEIHFDRCTAARIARVSKGFILKCEREELITSRTMLNGKKGLCFTDVCKLKQIRHFHEDLGLDFEAVDFILRYRDCIKLMQNRFEELEKEILNKEKKYRAEIKFLRKKLSEV